MCDFSGLLAIKRFCLTGLKRKSCPLPPIPVVLYTQCITVSEGRCRQRLRSLWLVMLPLCSIPSSSAFTLCFIIWDLGHRSFFRCLFGDLFKSGKHKTLFSTLIRYPILSHAWSSSIAPTPLQGL